MFLTFPSLGQRRLRAEVGVHRPELGCWHADTAGWSESTSVESPTARCLCAECDGVMHFRTRPSVATPIRSRVLDARTTGKCATSQSQSRQGTKVAGWPGRFGGVPPISLTYQVGWTVFDRLLKAAGKGSRFRLLRYPKMPRDRACDPKAAPAIVARLHTLERRSSMRSRRAINHPRSGLLRKG